MFEIICQIMIPVLGIPALYLLTNNDRRGYLLGLASQPFWISTAIRNDQWGMIAIEAVYATVWIRGAWKAYRK